jgi:hypothetical protein
MGWKGACRLDFPICRKANALTAAATTEVSTTARSMHTIGQPERCAGRYRCRKGLLAKRRGLFKEFVRGRPHRRCLDRQMLASVVTGGIDSPGHQDGTRAFTSVMET